MYHPKILAAIEGGQWAMTATALEAIVKLASREISSADYETFHKASEARKDAVVAELGERAEGTRYSYINDGVGLVYIDGPIIPRADMFSEASGMVSVESLAKDLKALEAAGIKDVILVMDTPGGAVVGISEFAQLIRESAMNIDAFVYGMAASAGYWIASATGKIYIVDTGEVGSIGVVSTYRDQSKRNEAEGIEMIEIVSSQSPYKRVDVKTPEGREKAQAVVDTLADVFVGTVAVNMGTTVENVLENFGQGGLLVGQQAVDAGMAHGVTTLEKLIKEKNNGSSSSNGGSDAILKGNSLSNKPKSKVCSMEPNEIVAAYPDAAKKIQNEAIEGEQSRIKAIEALSASVANMGPNAVSAAGKVISENKFDSTKSAAEVSGLILGAVNASHKDIAKNTADSARAAADLAAAIPGSGDEEIDELDTDKDKAEAKATSDDILGEL